MFQNSLNTITATIVIVCAILVQNVATELCEDSCQNGICVTGSESKCFCLNGYTGENCDKVFDHCAHNPCRNNATCKNSGAEFKCHCQAGYCGKLCDEDFDDCSSSPCQNGGVCVDKLAGFECLCSTGFSGSHCEQDVDSCSSESLEKHHNITELPCLNNGTCVDGPGSRFWCVCADSFTGARCESSVDHCSSNPCQNSGKCRSNTDGFHCSCAYGYTGSHCEISLHRCEEDSHKEFCLNDAFCMRTDADKLHCFCRQDFFGERCENRFDDCLGDSCENGGRCVDGVDSYTCACPVGYRGHRCEVVCDDDDQLDDVRCQGSVVDATTTSTTVEPPATSKNIPSQIPQHLVTTTEKPILVPESMSRIVSPFFNGIDSELVFKVRRYKRKTSHIRLQFSPDSPDGVILYANTSRYHLALYLQHSNLVVHLFDQQAAEFGLKIEPEVEFSSNQQYQVHLSLSRNRTNDLILGVFITQNGARIFDREESTPDFGSVPCFEHYQFGALNSATLGDEFPRFSGCLAHIELNGVEKFSRDAIHGHNVSECRSTAVCSGDTNPCKNSGVCQELETSGDGDHTWKCDCKPGFSGWLCQNLVCTSDHCLNDGLCLVSEEQRKHLCICTSGFYGPRCESKLNLTYPLFGVNHSISSFIKYRLPVELGEFIEIRLRLISHSNEQRSALVLALKSDTKPSRDGGDDGGDEDVKQSPTTGTLKLYFDRSTLLLRANVADETRTVRTTLPGNVTEQMVLLGRFRNTFWLLVVPAESNTGRDTSTTTSSPNSRDLQPQIGRLSRSQAKHFVLGPELWIGGIGDDDSNGGVVDPLDYRRHNGFHGCVYDIDVRSSPNANFTRLEDQQIDLLANVEQCDFECT